MLNVLYNNSLCAKLMFYTCEFSDCMVNRMEICKYRGGWRAMCQNDSSDLEIKDYRFMKMDNQSFFISNIKNKIVKTNRMC